VNAFHFLQGSSTAIRKDAENGDYSDIKESLVKSNSFSQEKRWYTQILCRLQSTKFSDQARFVSLKGDHYVISRQSHIFECN